MNRRYALAVVPLVATLGLSACGSGGGYGAQKAASKRAGDTSAGSKLATSDVTKLGQVVTDGAGFTLYRFDADTANPSASNCNGACATAWPPVVVSKLPAGTGITAKVGTVTRGDGTKQATLNGWPVYRFGNDSAPGQANGQGVGGTWFAVTPDGGKAKAGATVPTGDEPSSGYGY